MSDEEPRKLDILFGKGSDCWNHYGNKKFRVLVANYQGKYHSMQCRSEKVELVAHIVQEISSTGTRFLRRNVESKAWEKVERKTIIEKVGLAIRDKQQAKYRKRENSSMSNFTEVRDINNVNQRRDTRMVNNGYLRPILSQGLIYKVNFQIEDSISSNPVLLNHCEQHLKIGHATYDGSLISGFSVDRSMIPYQPYSQRNDNQYLGDLALSVPILRCSRYDDLDGSGLRRRLGERISNAKLRPSRLESQLLTYLRQQAHVDTLHYSTFGLNILQENIFSDLRFFRRFMNGAPSVQTERFIHSLR